MILGYSGPATSRAIHLFDRPNYDLDSSFVTPVVVRSTSKYSLSIGYRAHSSLLDCARWPNSAINCVTNAPLSRAEVFTVLLIDYEAWVCDLNPRDINGPAWCTQLYPLWTDGFFACSEPRADRGDGAVPSCSISRRYIALRGTTANGHIPYLPASETAESQEIIADSRV